LKEQTPEEGNVANIGNEEPKTEIVSE